MGTPGYIVRRLSPEYIQYGYCGQSGYYSISGERLLEWYNDPDIMDYLFGLGQLSLIGKPGSERGGEPFMYSNIPTGEPHYVGRDETDPFHNYFMDYCYFFDNDNTWYCILPRGFLIKVPLRYIANHADEEGMTQDVEHELGKSAAEYILREFIPQDKELSDLIAAHEKPYEETAQAILADAYPLTRLNKVYYDLYKVLDPFIVMKTDEENMQITRILMKKKQSGKRIQTIDWK